LKTVIDRVKVNLWENVQHEMLQLTYILAEMIGPICKEHNA